MQIATIIMSVPGPLVGVFAAWRLSRRDDVTSSAHQLFAKIYSDMQMYQHCFQRLHAFLFNAAKHGPPASPPPAVDPNLALKEREAELNTDCLMLGLMFGRKADRAGAAIQELIAVSELFNKNEVPPIKDCVVLLSKRTQDITEEVRKLPSLLPKW